MDYKKFADAFSMAKAAELENDRYKDKTIGILLEVIGSESQRTQESLRKSGLFIESIVKSTVIGTAKIKNLSQISHLECVKSIEISTRLEPLKSARMERTF